ncbi:hypothetical protein CNMCM5623_008379 [Aspergillus felis]|uniref:PWI domain-containing protein n=1 Tax=Aspergillus felis TaxID=1287682 RepID=A0A8H6PZD2_9EURO|nr:hypothetical protein CNMCM5623_008379 [Aspergillus felis]KAF7177340.1 hypothetical protein CNMCM7691_005299 [Aspergillus felis]
MASSIDAKLLKQTKFPPEFNRKVDMKKVNIEVMKKWIAGKISEILGNEDDVVIELCFNLLEGSRFPDIKSLQIQLTGFLDKDTAKFCKDLWSLCLSAQENPQGVAKELLEAKKLELIQEKVGLPDCLTGFISDADTIPARSRLRKQRKKLAARRSKSKHAKGSWKKSGEENASIAIGAGEVAVVGAETSIDGHTGTIDRHPGDEAASDFVIHPQGESLILTFPQVRAGAVDLQGRPAPLPPALVPFPHLGPRLVDAYQAETDTAINVAAPRVAPSLQKEETTGDREDAVQTTVIELDPFPAVIHRAHVLPEETEGDEHLSLPAVHPGHLLPATGAVGKTDPAPGADSAKAHKSRDDRRLSRTRDRDDERRRRRSTRSVSRSRGRSRTGSVSPRRASRSRSRSRSHARERKRRRSIERYAPAARRRRNTSSVSTHTEKRQRMADPTEESAKRSSPPPEQPSSTDHETKDTEETIHSKSNRPRISSTELREKLLREKLVAMRRTASHDKVGGNTIASK